jgi:hypothetical protein
LSQQSLPLWQASLGVFCANVSVSNLCSLLKHQHSWLSEGCSCSVLLEVQAACMDSERFDDAWALRVQAKIQRFLLLQRWLRQHGSGLLQMQCNSNFDQHVCA